MSARNELLEAALAYAAQGFLVLPLKGKRPVTAHGLKDATRDPKKIREFWSQFPWANIGVVTGEASNLVVLDTDSPEGEASYLTLCGGLAPKTRTHRTGRGCHYLYRHPGKHVVGRIKLRPGLDVRADGNYIVMPPSVHPDTGQPYQVEDPSIPIADLPPCLLVALFEAPSRESELGDAQGEADGDVHEGGRNYFLTRIAGRLRGAAGLDIAALAHLLHFYNETRCKPPLAREEVDRVVASAAKWVRGDTMVEELNKQYAVIETGGHARILQEYGDGEFTLLGVSDFRTLLSNQWVTDDGPKRQRSVADVWLRSPHRRQFSRVVFEPGKKRTPGAFNLFKGWAVEPRAGDCSLFLAHLRDNICSGNERLYRWVCAWFADLFQHPDRKPGTSLVLRGKQGSGKSICGAIIGRLLGPHYASVATADRVTGRFNSHLAQCLLLQAEEAFWGGARSEAGALKDLITSGVQYIERKGVDAVTVANHVRLMVTSNELWVVPAGLEERRFCVIEVGDGQLQNREYFRAMMAQMEQGGYEALLEYFLTLDISDIDLRHIPRTRALTEQKIASMPSELKWLLDRLVAGELPGDVTGNGVVPSVVLHDHYIKHAQRVGFSRRSSETELGNLLKKHVPGIARKRMLVKTRDGQVRRVACHCFPSLVECRRAFSQLTQQAFDWPDDDGQWLAAPEGDI